MLFIFLLTWCFLFFTLQLFYHLILKVSGIFFLKFHLLFYLFRNLFALQFEFLFILFLYIFLQLLDSFFKSFKKLKNLILFCSNCTSKGYIRKMLIIFGMTSIIFKWVRTNLGQCLFLDYNSMSHDSFTV